MNDNSSKGKIGFFSAMCLAIGTIVGAGVFGTIPAAAEMVGAGIEWAYVIAFLSIIVCYLPQMVTISALPAPYTYYMHATRMVNPTVGYMTVIFGFNYVFILSALAGVFAQYAGVYIPVDQKILAVGVLVLFAAITCCGVEANAVLQNIMVVALFIALATYFILGAPHLDASLVSMKSVVIPQNISIVAFGSTVALLSSSLQGGVTIAFYPDEILNPGKNVPKAFIFATAVCCIAFMMVSVITIGILPMDQVTSLLDVANKILPTGLYHFFILAGALFAVMTSLNGTFLAGGHIGKATSDDLVMPEWLGRNNKHNVPKNTVWLLAVVAGFFVVSGFPIGTLLTAYSLLNLFTLLLMFIPALKFHKEYPHTFKHAAFKMPIKVTVAMTILGIGFCIWQLVSTMMTLDMAMIAIIVLWYAAWYTFYFGRKVFLKKKGIDLDKQMRTPYPAWVEKENELAKLDGEIDCDICEVDEFDEEKAS